MKKLAMLILAAVMTVSLFSACGKAEEEPIDVSDVKDMVFGSEEPIILYYGEEKIIIDGDFGVIRYDLENSKLTDRISADQIREWGMPAYGNYASADGGTLYFTDMRQIDGVTTSFVAYDIESKTVSDIMEMTEEGLPDETFGVKQKHYDPAKYEKYFEKYKGNNCLISSSVLLDSGEFVFLIMPDGQFYELEVIVYDDNGDEKVYKVFNDDN